MLDLIGTAGTGQALEWILTLGRSDLRQVRGDAEVLLGDLRKSRLRGPIQATLQMACHFRLHLECCNAGGAAYCRARRLLRGGWRLYVTPYQSPQHQSVLVECDPLSVRLSLRDRPVAPWVPCDAVTFDKCTRAPGKPRVTQSQNHSKRASQRAQEDPVANAATAIW